MAVVADPTAYFAAAALHDAYVDRMVVSLEDRSLELWVDDLDAATVNPPVVPPRPGRLVLLGLSELRLGVATAEGVRISSIAATGHTGHYQLTIALSLGGIPSESDTWWITARFASLELIET